MARNPSIYTGMCQGAATRRNRAIRAAQRHRALARRDFTPQQARSYLSWDLRIEGTFILSDDGAVSLARELAAKAFKEAVRRVRYWHREWKHYTRLNREWRSEMATIERKFA